MGRRRCPICSSTQWHKEPSTGLITCSEGHILQNYRNETADATDLGPHALRKRTLKSERRPREKLETSSIVFHGQRARYHYFQCLQLLLRKQIAVLAHIWNLPDRFESTCRDVWALHISLLSDPLSHESFSKADDNASPIDGDRDDIHTREAIRTKFQADNEYVSSSASNHSQNPNNADSELAALMREASVSSEPNEGLNEVSSTQHQEQLFISKSKGKRRLQDGPIVNLAIIIVGCWLLRVPVIPMDILRLVKRYDLPYMDPCSHLPPEMTELLNTYTKKMLTPRWTPRARTVHTTACQLAKRLYSRCQIRTPELNAAPLLWRVVRAFGGNPILYAQAKKVAAILAVPLTLHHSLAPPLDQVKYYEPSRHEGDNDPIELSLTAVVIVVLKLWYGYDGRRRMSSENADIGNAAPTEAEHLKFLGFRKYLDERAFDRLLQPSEHRSAPQWENSEIDQYLMFCEKALVHADDAVQTGFEGVRDIFEDGLAEDVNMDQKQAEPEPKMGEEEGSDGDDPIRRGEHYVIYNSQDLSGELPRSYELVLDTGARWTGSSREGVEVAVERLERRLVKWLQRTRARGYK